jgi:hypothetical protein
MQIIKINYTIGFFVTLVVFLSAPFMVLAYDQSGYYGQGYYQSYYQGYYQSYYQSYYQGTYQTNFTTGVTVQLDLSITGSIVKGSGTFLIDHPLDPKNKLLYHSFVESPDVKNIYDGVATLNENGEIAINLPDYFEALNKDFRYQVKPIGQPQPNLYIKEEVGNNQFTIAGGVPNGKISWQVTGIRHDPYIEANPIVTEVLKGSDQPVGRGEYVFDGYERSVLPSFRPFFAIFEELFTGLSE